MDLRDTTSKHPNNDQFGFKFHLQSPDHVYDSKDEIGFDEAVEDGNVRPSRELVMEINSQNLLRYS